MSQFLHTLSVFRRNEHINAFGATLRHTAWQFRKLLNAFPCEVSLGEKTRVIIKNRAVADGCGGLLNAMGYYDPNNMLFLDEIFRSRTANVFFDIGANIGVYSLIAGCHTTVAGFAFEPHPQTYRLLQENIDHNGLNDRVQCFQIALGNSNGSVELLDQPGSTVNRVIAARHSGMTVAVPCMKGEDFCFNNNAHPQVIKLDVEGHENEVIGGFGTSISHAHILLIECADVDRTSKILETYNFMGPYKVDYRKRELSADYNSYEDWVFLSQEGIKQLHNLGFKVAAIGTH